MCIRDRCSCGHFPNRHSPLQTFSLDIIILLKYSLLILTKKTAGSDSLFYFITLLANLQCNVACAGSIRSIIICTNLVLKVLCYGSSPHHNFNFAFEAFCIHLVDYFPVSYTHLSPGSHSRQAYCAYRFQRSVFRARTKLHFRFHRT